MSNIATNAVPNTATNVVNATDATFEQEVERHPGLVIVDFWAPWCGPCRAIAPSLEQLAAERAGVVKVVKVDIDQNMQTSTRFNVRAVPTLLFFKGGQVVAQIVGAVPKARIVATLEQHA